MSDRALVILQARMSSKRFPGKVLEDVNGEPMIIRQINRILHAKNIEKLIVVTTKDHSDDSLSAQLLSRNIEIYRGEVNDVISRFIEVVLRNQISTVVRLTADCPLVMPDLIDCMVEDFWKRDCDYLSNTIVPTFPDGLDVEIFSKDSLLRLSKFKLTIPEREHVTLGFHRMADDFIIHNFLSFVDYSSMRWTVDYPQDLAFIRTVYNHFLGREDEFKFLEILDLFDKKLILNSEIPPNRRNEALIKDF